MDGIDSDPQHGLASFIVRVVEISEHTDGMTPHEQEPDTRILVVAGPTASGKSSLALEVALQMRARGKQAEIVSLDSVQIYRACDIGSAKLMPHEQRGVPHHLLSVLSPNEPLDAKRFLDLAHNAIAEVVQRGAFPIVVGGTSMYLTLLLHGISAAPRAEESVRQTLRELGSAELYKELQVGDPHTAERLHPNDRVRVERAVETLRTLGVPLSSLHAEHRFKAEHYRALIVVPCWPRDVLYERINARTMLMVESGLLKEAKALYDSYGAELHVFDALGYRQALDVIMGRMGERDLAQRVAQLTRNFAKRQMTFLRNEPAKRGWEVLPSQTEVEPSSIVGKASRKAFRTIALSYESLGCRLDEWRETPKERNEIWYLEAPALQTVDCR